MEKRDEQFKKDLEYMLRLLRRVEYLEKKAKDQLETIDSLTKENARVIRRVWHTKDEKPEKAGTYLCTLFDMDGTFLELCEWNDTFGGRWQAVFEGEDSYSDIGNVLAWMPLPEPWKGEDDGRSN